MKIKRCFGITNPRSRHNRSQHTALATVIITFSLLPAQILAETCWQRAQQRAVRERLWEKPQWRALIHYEPQHAGPGTKSLVTTNSFFLQ